MSGSQQNPSTRHDGRVLFISDLHLCESRPAITHTFLQFLNDIAATAQALYILGDLFEYWAGDDAATPLHAEIIEAFALLHAKGTQVYLMHGNRDFLIGSIFCQQAKITLIADPTLIQLGETFALLSHGDALCTDDVAYQKMRAQFREPAWQAQFLSQPLSTRQSQIAHIRMQSEAAKAEKSMVIMDVNAEAVCELLSAYHFPPIFIHGHTHRPNTHLIEHGEQQTIRYVLGDWYEQGSCLSFENGKLQTITLA
jgi:UDP-2,3-diacylglucosamine hydrolase